MWMSRVFILGLASGAILPSLAGATEQEVELTATVSGYCSFGTPTIDPTFNVTPGATSPTVSNASISVPTGAGGVMADWGFTLTMNGTCNKTSLLQLASVKGGLKDPGHTTPAPLGFVNRFDYHATVSAPGIGPVDLPETSGTPISSPPPPPGLSAGLFSKTISLTVSGDPDPGIVMAGSYSDALIISLVPQ
jgi:hypothetical protein